jgi:hypothetical protein
VNSYSKDALWERSYFIVTGDRLPYQMTLLITSLARGLGVKFSIDVKEHIEDVLAELDMPDDALGMFSHVQREPQTDGFSEPIGAQ